MTDYKKIVQVIQILPDMDQATGERYTQVTFGFESSALPSGFPDSPRIPFWKYAMHVFIPISEWKDQYKIWHRYEMVVKDTGEMVLRPVPNTSRNS